LIALLIKIESPGNVFYRQKRIKKHGEHGLDTNFIPRAKDIFLIYKFRTMRNGAEDESGAVNAIKDDPRVTRVGKYLRATRLDEVPNLINVLMGHMSVIGPRADRPEILSEVEDEFPNVWDRTRFVKPGITGLAQVELRSNGELNGNKKFAEALPESDKSKPVRSFRYKLYWDFAYQTRLTEFWSFLITDLTVILRTPIVMFFKKNTI
jgi:lipopolysaccharide/colanic/teichoic acid biosynthesis glycosyltransferase